MTRAILALLLMTGTAHAQACGPREKVAAKLAKTYGESRRAVGLGSNNTVMEVFASDATGSWTITATSAEGVMCLIASGEAFGVLPPAPVGDPT